MREQKCVIFTMFTTVWMDHVVAGWLFLQERDAGKTLGQFPYLMIGQGMFGRTLNFQCPGKCKKGPNNNHVIRIGFKRQGKWLVQAKEFGTFVQTKFVTIDSWMHGHWEALAT